MPAPGPKRKSNVRRSANGKSRGEIIDITLILNQPHRRGYKDPANPLLGYPLGRLNYSGEIDTEQLRAGNAWAGMVRAYAKMMGIPITRPSNLFGECVSSGFYHWEMDELDDVEKAKRKALLRDTYDQCYNKLLELGRDAGVSTAALIICRKICIQEIDSDLVLNRKAALSLLRQGLNVLSRILAPVDSRGTVDKSLYQVSGGEII